MAQTTSGDRLPAVGAGTGASLILLLLFTNYLTRPLDTIRASGPAIEWAPANSAQQIPARLWQDPLAAAYDAFRQSRTEGDHPKQPLGMPLPRLAAELNREVCSSSDGPTDALVVLVPGGSSGDAQETRIRTRFAVVSALGTSNLSPVDGDSLGYVLLDTAPVVSRLHFTGPLILPFEWFNPSIRPHARTLVLWVDENTIADAPLVKLDWLLSQVCTSDGSSLSTCGSIRLIGPSNSGMLLAMQRDDADWPNAVRSGAAVLERSTLFSPWSTLSTFAEGRPTYRFPRSGLKFVRTVGTDTELAQLLTEELRLRFPERFPDASTWYLVALRAALRVTGFVQAQSGPLRVALVTERDTEYGRAWRSAFKAVAEHSGLSSQIEFDNTVQYLRGLDGVGLRPGASRPGAPDTPSAALQRSAIGPSQLDYLRRLDRQLEDKAFDAIGILGSDEYDKLAILDTLRPRFPSAVFFTTDLDARFLPASGSRNSLNLVVASHYGLSLTAELQQGLAPFRSSYQAAVYVSVLAAEGTLKQDTRDPHYNALPLPWIFEIGRTGAFPLRAADQTIEPTVVPIVQASAQPQPHAPNLELGQRVHSWILRSPGNAIGCVAALAVYLFCALQLRSVRLRLWSFWTAMRPPEKWFMLGLGALVLGGTPILYKFIDLQDRSPSGEPFFWIEGLSIWPTICLRLVATLVCLVGVVKVATECRRMKDYIEERMHIAHASNTSTSGFGRRWSEFVSQLPLVRLSRDIALRASIYYLLIGATFWLLRGDAPPARGELSFLADRLTLFVSVVLFIYLVFLVLRVASLAKLFLNDASKQPHKWWPYRSLHECCVATGLPPDEGSRVLLVHLGYRIASTVIRFVWYPAVALSLLIVSRSGLFARWSWPIALVVTFCAGFILLLISARNVRRVMRDLRADQIEQLSLSKLRNAHDSVLTARLVGVIEALNSMHAGVFAPILEHPVLRAGLLPVLGISVNAIVEAVAPMIVARLN
jgi:hypothetical protein